MGFTASTNYASQKNLPDWNKYQVETVLGDIVYDGNSPPTGGSAVAYELWLDNGTMVTQSEAFSYTSTTSQTFNWSVTEPLSIGIEVDATEGLPGVAQVTEKLTVKVGLSSTQGGSSTKTQSWTVDSPVTVPSNASVKCEIVISSQSYDIDYIQPLTMTNYVAIEINDWQDWNHDGQMQKLWFIPITQVFQDVIANNLIDTTGYQLTPNSAIATARGTFTGSQGIDVTARITQYPLRTSGTTGSAAAVGEPVATTLYPRLIAGPAR